MQHCCQADFMGLSHCCHDSHAKTEWQIVCPGAGELKKTHKSVSYHTSNGSAHTVNSYMLQLSGLESKLNF